MKKVWFILTIIMLLLVILQIQISYSKYVLEAQGTIEKEPGKWVIKVNNQNITSNNSVSNFNINSITYVNNTYVVSNKMAPSSMGYFDVIIDPTGTSTAVKYEMTINNQGLQSNSFISLDHACVVTNGVEDAQALVQTDVNTYSGIIDLNSIKNEQTTTVRFYINWGNVADGSNDVNDSVYGLTKNSSISIPVSVVVSQYLGEQLTTYNTNSNSNTISNTNTNANT